MMRRRETSAILPALVVLVGGMLSARPVAAQPVKPNILLIFDTSGSMLYNDRGRWRGCDGQYPPVGDSSDGVDTRIYNLKQAILQALALIGTDEANFGLLRFPQLEDPAGLDSCDFPTGQAGYYRIDPLQQGGADDNPGCKLSTHNNETTAGAWFLSGMGEAIVVPVTDAAAGLVPTGPGDFDPLDANLPAIFPWLDHYTESNGSGIDNAEIQAIPDQHTPLGRSLFYARLYFDTYIFPNDEPDLLPCRNNIVVLITDGAESCDSNMSFIPDDPQQPSDCEGIIYDEFNPRRQACLLYRPWIDPPYLSVKTYVLTMTGFEQANDPIAKAGGTGAALKADFTDQDQVKAAFLSIIADAVPAGEVCNGKDDNCNGVADEGVSNNCPFDPINLTHCAVELCNNIDDDCDGQIDEGLPPNPCGGPCGEPVGEEIPCNGQDDDCDPSTPDEPPECICGVELCNGVDDDCDLLVDDDDPDLPTDLPCGPNPALGECRQGIFVCNYGDSYCDGAVWPEPEVCNNLDEDCNGIVDDVVYDPPDCVVPDCETACCAGHWECINGVDTCVPNAITATEACNAEDDDCDNRIDEGATCEWPLICYYGTCVFRVPPDGCGPGYFSREGVCITDACLGSHCPGGTICDPATGDCVDPCAGYTCATAGAFCDVTLATCDATGCTVDEDACVSGDCYLDPALCDDGEVCEEGACTDDDCFGADALDCGDRACRDGACVNTCVGVECDPGERCEDGQCQAAPCGAFSCPPGQSCVLGQCAQDPCGGVTCGVSRVCQDGECVDDPCRLIVCPPGVPCENGQCVTPPQQPDGGVVTDAGPATDAATPMDGAATDSAAPAPDSGQPREFSIWTGGGGCACHTSRTPTGGVLLLFATLLWLIRRRRSARSY